MVNIEPERVVQLLRQGLSFLETEYQFVVEVDEANDRYVEIAWVRGSTYLGIDWDFQKMLIGEEFYPWDPEAAAPVWEGRTLLDDLIAINGGPASEIVRAPREVTEASVAEAAEAIARLLRTYAADLLEDRWGDTRRRVQEWKDAGERGERQEEGASPRRSRGQRTQNAPTRETRPDVQYVRKHAQELSIVLAELAESAEVAGSAWSRAVTLVETDPGVAETHLFDAHMRLHDVARGQVRGALRVLNRAMRLLAAELRAPATMSLEPEQVVQILRERLAFLEVECGFQVASREMEPIYASIAWVRGSTYLAIGWDFREHDLGEEFYPWDPEAAAPVWEGRTLLDDLIAINGGPASEIVRAPREVTEASVAEAAEAIARLLRTYAADLLEDRWGDTRRRVQEWKDADRWTEWREAGAATP